MKLTIFVLAVSLLFSTAIFAEDASAEMQAMSAKIMSEVSAGLQCQIASIKLAKENEALKARVKELENKENAPAK